MNESCKNKNSFIWKKEKVKREEFFSIIAMNFPKKNETQQQKNDIKNVSGSELLWVGLSDAKITMLYRHSCVLHS